MSRLSVRCLPVIMIASFFLCDHALSFETNIITTEQVNPLNLVPSFPVLGSAAQKRDMDAVIQAGRDRTPEQSTKALADDQPSVFRFADVLGPRFAEKELPMTTKFFEDLFAVHRAVLDPAKEVWNRPRPYTINTELRTIGERPPTSSYPSGHSHFGYLSGIVLARIIPEKAAELIARGQEYGDNRLLMGLHYPTDVEASRPIAAALATALFANPTFKTELSAVKSELRPVLGYQK